MDREEKKSSAEVWDTLMFRDLGNEETTKEPEMRSSEKQVSAVSQELSKKKDFKVERMISCVIGYR